MMAAEEQHYPEAHPEIITLDFAAELAGWQMLAALRTPSIHAQVVKPPTPVEELPERHRNLSQWGTSRNQYREAQLAQLTQEFSRWLDSVCPDDFVTPPEG